MAASYLALGELHQQHMHHTSAKNYKRSNPYVNPTTHRAGSGGAAMRKTQKKRTTAKIHRVGASGGALSNGQVLVVLATKSTSTLCSLVEVLPHLVPHRVLSCQVFLNLRDVRASISFSLSRCRSESCVPLRQEEIEVVLPHELWLPVCRILDAHEQPSRDCECPGDDYQSWC